MAYEAKGTIEFISEEQVISDKFKKIEFVLSIPDGAYSQSVKFQLTNDKCDLMDKFAVGQEVNVHFNLQGKAFEKNGSKMYFTNLGAWRIEPASGATSKSPAAATSFAVDDQDDSLPF